MRVRITQDKRSYAFAEVEAVIEPSPERIEPRCKHFGVCGGCHWQHIDYAAQLRFKRDVVVEQMARIGGLRDVLVHPTIASPDPWNIAHTSPFTSPARGGSASSASMIARVIPIDECPIIRPELSDWFEAIRHERIQAGRARPLAGRLARANIWSPAAAARALSLTTRRRSPAPRSSTTALKAVIFR